MTSLFRAARKTLGTWGRRDMSFAEDDEEEGGDEYMSKTVQLARARKGGLYDKEAAAVFIANDLIDSEADPGLSLESRSTFDSGSTVTASSLHGRRRTGERNVRPGMPCKALSLELEGGECGAGDGCRLESAPGGAVFMSCQDWRSPLQDALEKPSILCGEAFRKVTTAAGRTWQMLPLYQQKGVIMEAPAHIFIKPDQDMSGQTDFYFEGMTRQQATLELRKRHVTEGTFIVRPCETDEFNYSLSVVNKRQQVFHYKILTTNMGTFVIKFGPQLCVQFDTMAELISRYRQPIMLAHRARPCTRLQQPYRFNPEDMDNENLNDCEAFTTTCTAVSWNTEHPQTPT